MKPGEFRELSQKELADKIVALEENIFRLHCNKTLGQLEDSSAIKKARRDIARAKTVLREKQLVEA
ncbi:MAG: 50S ribosomal protein L29 [Candidatus Lambdaproteobacteria bacterium RIFOXYD12_FULL_49_8]|uniref:Large ribosomal subunit protein uL29 n=1 Tax=Candidatus Lambdaproteobacteria bacterium RIFOXYD2_FULL_50_16 TaxID=1817772 RepID=A0A1F6G6F1_9PROT|nr:MAG: 50S ribosomal protein L29 [Candidatus Lambdaproteobacteria bacterium RIFOXYD2_FULL_50_16]OGG96399.1 MAG: 50S ribosomal protein L29 [Candidatus Lambdaproteobacteria bacterium RIFOXYD12_FULL_49_8]